MTKFEELAQILHNNPELPVKVLATTPYNTEPGEECVLNIANVGILKFYDGKTLMHFYNKDVDEAVAKALDDANGVFTGENYDADLSKREYEHLPWQFGIFVIAE